MSLTLPPRNARTPVTTPTTTAPTTTTTTAPATTTTTTAPTKPAPPASANTMSNPPTTNPAVANSPAPVGKNAVPLINESELKKVLGTTQALATSSNPAIANTFGAANDAAQRLQKATTIEVPIRLQVTTGKSAQALQNRTPAELPGMLKEQNGVVTFYPADEQLRPFDVDATAAQFLPRDVVLIARVAKKQIDIALPDGSIERAPIYTVGNSPLPQARQQFVGIVDFVGGKPFVRDLVPPVRMLALDALNLGGAAAEGSIVDVSVENGAVVVNKTVADKDSPLARTWQVAGAQKLDAVFSKQSIAEAKAIEAAAAASLADASLVDLTAKPFFAIDNDHSRDIDQAMHLEKRPDGGYVLSYALADAAHYIKPGSSLFEGGMQRGASFYLPGLSISMLPDTLSEGVISLNAHEDHRAMVLQIRLDKDGNVEGKPDVLRAKVHSQAQITYNGVSAELEGRGKVTTDTHGKPVPAAVSAQLKLFEELGKLRMAQAQERGVVSPERREMVIGNHGGRFSLEERKSDYASKLNAEMSILANVAGAEGFASKIPGIEVPGIFKTHDEPNTQALRALGRQAATIVEKNGLPKAWAWKRDETLAQWVERLKVLPTSSREKKLAQVLQMTAVRINVASGFSREATGHSGLKLMAYGRFSAPMREQVGILSHAVLFAKTALEKAFDEAKLTPAQAQALWAPLLLGSLVEPNKIPPARQQLAKEAQALLTTTGPAFVALAQKLAAQASSTQPGGGPLTPAEQKLVDDVMDRATNAGNNGKMKQGQVEGASMKLLFDDLFNADLGGNPLGNPSAPKRHGTVTSVTPAKVYVQLDDPDVEVRLSIDDLRRGNPNLNFHLEDEGVSLVVDGTNAALGASGQFAPASFDRLLVGQEINLQATHHDGDRLHFGVVD